jgi:ATP-dependent phosphofructokinase / diphosphate-dependent phosphofructokinase
MANKTKGLKIGILTAGGDCPGINAAIRGVGKTAITEYGMRVFGITSGFRGLIDKEVSELEEDKLSGILTLGGTILGTSREKPFKGDPYKESSSKQIIKNYKDLGLDALVIIGGNGTMKTASKLANEGTNVVGIPKTIDNDVWGTDVTFGFDSAVWIATEAIDRLHTTANSHKRIMVIELMGHHAGWITLFSGIAGGGDVILIPEIPYDLDVVAQALLKRNKNKKPYSIVVVAEGIEKPRDIQAGTYITRSIQEKTGLESRETILGYVQRGGGPSPMDRLLATRYGSFAVDLIAQKKFGNMVQIINNQLGAIPLSEVAGKLKLVPPDLALIEKSRRMDISFGNRL